MIARVYVEQGTGDIICECHTEEDNKLKTVVLLNHEAYMIGCALQAAALITSSKAHLLQQDLEFFPTVNGQEVPFPAIFKGAGQ